MRTILCLLAITTMSCIQEKEKPDNRVFPTPTNTVSPNPTAPLNPIPVPQPIQR